MAIALLGCVGCGDTGVLQLSAPAGDAGIVLEQDAGLARMVEPVAAEAPSFTPCPDGWHAVTPEREGDPVTCTAWPGGEPEACAAGSAHFPGTESCAPVGARCPEGVFAADLPSDGVVYVQPGASGDGSRDRPFGALADVPWSSLAQGSTVALSKGEFETDGVFLPSGVTLRGACVAETRLRSSGGGWTTAVVSMRRTEGGVVRDLTIGQSGRSGVLAGGGSGTLRGVIIEDVIGLGIGVVQGELEVERVVVRGVQPNGAGRLGRGLHLEPGGSVTARQLVAERNADIGVFAHQAGTHLDLADCVVRDTESLATDASGQGLAVLREATATVRRCLFERNRNVGVTVSSDGVATMEDVVIRDTESIPGGPMAGLFGRGLILFFGGRVELRRALIDGNQDVGVSVLDADSELNAEDLVIVDTQPRSSDGEFGVGLGVQSEAHVALTRGFLARNHTAGITVQAVTEQSPPARLQLADTVVRETLPSAASGAFGRGLNVQLSAVLSGERVRVGSTSQVGAFIGGAGASATLTDFELSRAAVPPCELCPRVGMGVGAYGGATLELERFQVSQAATCGLHLAGQGEADLRRGRVRASTIGVCLEGSGYDVRRLTDRVHFEDNRRNLSSPELPVPEGLGSL